MQALKLVQFPKIKQKDTNWCIPAAVENVIRFHGGDVSQDDIFSYYIEKYHHIDDIDIDKVKDILERHFSQNYSYRIVSKRTSKIIREATDVVSLIKRGIHNGLPSILLVEFPSCWYLPGYSTHCDHYVFTTLGFSQNCILIWDTNPKTLNIPVVVENYWIKKHLSSNLLTFWVIPNKKLETFEELLTEILA